MKRRVRVVLAAAAIGTLAVILGWGVAGLPEFGHYHGAYGNLVSRSAVPDRHVTNVVTSIVFDYRGFDTLGEEFILFASVVGVTLLLRRHGEDEDEDQLLRSAPDDSTRSDAVRFGGISGLPPLFVLGLWVVAFGLLTPGGGFQGGVLLGGSILLVFLAVGFRPYKRLTPTPYVDLAEGSGAAAYALIGVGGLLAGGAYLENFLELGTNGALTAGGTMLLLNWATALAVAGAMLLLFSEFLQRYAVQQLAPPE